MKMQGLIKVTPESLIQLTEDCMMHIQSFRIESCEKTTHKHWSWSKFKFIEETNYKAPLWYKDRISLYKYMLHVRLMAENALWSCDQIWLSELGYKNMVLLKNGNKDANPIYIINY